MMESYASKSEDSLGRIYQEESSPHRSAFQRDRDRILHCGSFRKLQGSTDVRSQSSHILSMHCQTLSWEAIDEQVNEQAVN